MLSPLDTEDHVARLLLLTSAFALRDRSLDGLTKIAKLDFLLRYPRFLRMFLVDDGLGELLDVVNAGDEVLETRMIRYKYGPWDESYYSILAALLGKGLVQRVKGRGSIAIITTELGEEIAAQLRLLPTWVAMSERCDVLAEHYDLTGNALKERIYEELPEIVQLDYREEIS